MRPIVSVALVGGQGVVGDSVQVAKVLRLLRVIMVVGVGGSTLMRFLPSGSRCENSSKLMDRDACDRITAFGSAYGHNGL